MEISRDPASCAAQIPRDRNARICPRDCRYRMIIDVIAPYATPTTGSPILYPKRELFVRNGNSKIMEKITSYF